MFQKRFAKQRFFEIRRSRLKGHCFFVKTKKQDKKSCSDVAGETRFEHATGGFGDRCSTVEPLP